MKLYVRRSGKVFGPYPLDQINGFLNDGRLLKSDEASEDQESWESLESFLELEKKAQELELPEPESIEALLHKASPSKVAAKSNPDSSPSSPKQNPVNQNIEEDTNFNYLVYEHPTLGTKVIKKGFRWAALWGFAYYLYHKDYSAALQLVVITSLTLLVMAGVHKLSYDSFRDNHFRWNLYLDDFEANLDAQGNGKIAYTTLQQMAQNNKFWDFRQERALLAVDRDWKIWGYLFGLGDALATTFISLIFAKKQDSYLSRVVLKRGYKLVHTSNAESFDMALAQYSESKRQG